ncbi:hypothetical protein B5180_01705 [Streptomyces sp. BF-3]|nr:hypothetical protein B5180_01705 [Streptomyces sp. BF-3]
MGEREGIRQRVYDVLDNWTSSAAAPTSEVMAAVNGELDVRDAEIDRLKGQLADVCGEAEAFVAVTDGYVGHLRERLDRYRRAWLSARRRAAEEANLGAEAVEHIAADRDRWQRGHERAEAQLVGARYEVRRLRLQLRESTHGAFLERVGEVDGETVWRAKPAGDS